jgi:hypothetical protein
MVEAKDTEAEVSRKHSEDDPTPTVCGKITS